MSDARHEDALLVVQLGQLWTQLGGTKAVGWIWSDEFVSDYDEFKARFPPPSQESGYVRAIAGFNETVATLWKHKLIDEELLFDWLAVEGTWERLKGILVGMREESGEPRLWENFEAMAKAGARVA